MGMLLYLILIGTLGLTLIIFSLMLLCKTVKRYYLNKTTGLMPSDSVSYFLVFIICCFIHYLTFFEGLSFECRDNDISIFWVILNYKTQVIAFSFHFLSTACLIVFIFKNINLPMRFERSMFLTIYFEMLIFLVIMPNFIMFRESFSPTTYHINNNLYMITNVKFSNSLNLYATLILGLLTMQLFTLAIVCFNIIRCKCTQLLTSTISLSMISQFLLRLFWINNILMFKLMLPVVLLIKVIIFIELYFKVLTGDTAFDKQ